MYKSVLLIMFGPSKVCTVLDSSFVGDSVDDLAEFTMDWFFSRFSPISELLSVHCYVADLDGNLEKEILIKPKQTESFNVEDLDADSR